MASNLKEFDIIDPQTFATVMMKNRVAGYCQDSVFSDLRFTIKENLN